MFRAWYGISPSAGSTHSFRMSSGERAATVSIDTPPSVEAITTIRETDRSTTIPR
jgi:hypothetical protein